MPDPTRLINWLWRRMHVTIDRRAATARSQLLRQRSSRWRIEARCRRYYSTLVFALFGSVTDCRFAKLISGKNDNGERRPSVQWDYCLRGGICNGVGTTPEDSTWTNRESVDMTGAGARLKAERSRRKSMMTLACDFVDNVVLLWKPWIDESDNAFDDRSSNFLRFSSEAIFYEFIYCMND